MADTRSAKTSSKSTNPEKHADGRPLTFQTVEELDRAMQNCFAACDPHETQALVEIGRDAKGNLLYDTRAVLTKQQPYTMHGLACALDIDRRSLLNYKQRDEFFPSVQGALDRCAEYAEQQLYGPNGAKFSLTNKYGWSDRQVLAGDPDAPLVPIGLDAAILARMSGGEAPSSSAADSDQ